MNVRPSLLLAPLVLSLFAPATAGAISDCVFAGVNFSDGAISCQSGHQFRCSDGEWVSLDLVCETPPPAPAVVNPAECVCTSREIADCDQNGFACCVSLVGGDCSKHCCPTR
ncbi:hypothetical protein GMSM_36620 [Geomonas sp. Red276]